MITTDKTAKEIFHEVMQNPQRVPFGFGKKAVLVNVDPQKSYTRTDLYKTAYETDPRQLEYVNELAKRFRALGWPVVWTHVAFLDSLQNIKYGSDRAAFDERVDIDSSKDVIYTKRMPSAFFETPLQSLLVWHQVDTVIVTGGSTSGCVRATAVESLSRGYRTIVPEECVADKHESYHYANLTDLHLKYADVMKVNDVLSWLDERADQKG
jgi:nicotinamidase-related amidase